MKGVKLEDQEDKQARAYRACCLDYLNLEGPPSFLLIQVICPLVLKYDMHSHMRRDAIEEEFDEVEGSKTQITKPQMKLMSISLSSVLISNGQSADSIVVNSLSPWTIPFRAYLLSLLILRLA